MRKYLRVVLHPVALFFINNVHWIFINLPFCLLFIYETDCTYKEWNESLLFITCNGGCKCSAIHLFILIRGHLVATNGTKPTCSFD